MSAGYGGDRAWPVAFPPWVREVIIGRDTPPGWGRPACMVCGQPVYHIDIHHLLAGGMGGSQGRGRPSNGAVVHPEGEGQGCHVMLIHRQGRAARDNGWLRSRHVPKPGVYALPVNTWWRNPHVARPAADRPYYVVFLDEPGEQGRWWRPEVDNDSR
jgi:hypothetical protein